MPRSPSAGLLALAVERQVGVLLNRHAPFALRSRLGAVRLSRGRVYPSGRSCANLSRRGQALSSTAWNSRPEVTPSFSESRAVTIPLALGLGAGVAVGADPGSPTVPEYAPPFQFTGTIKRVQVDLSGQTIEDKAARFRAMMARQ